MNQRSKTDVEARLDALREEAARTGQVAGDAAAASGGPIPPGAKPHAKPGDASDSGSYYGLPPLKPPVWTWEVPFYFFVGGMAGASTSIAFVARITGAGNDLERTALWVALVSAFIGPLLLCLDLGRPERFLNMLRVFKQQSPMSVGAWTLVAFSAATLVAVVANEAVRAGLARDPMVGIAWAAEAMAAGLGLVLLSYTSVLLSATAIPVWSANRNVLAPHFVGSGIGSAAAMLELLGYLVPATQWLGIAISTWETLVGGRLELRNPRIDWPLRHGRSGWTARAGGALAGPIALALRLIYGMHSAGGRETAAVCFLVGALLTRYAWVWAGRASAADPQALFELQRRT